MTRADLVVTSALAVAAIAGAAPAQDTGTAIVRVATRPFTDEGTVRFTGSPGGELVLGSGAHLSAELPPGEHLSTLVTIGEDLADAGYELVEIQCDDEGSAHVSRGTADYRMATFRVESGEVVTCVFWLENERLLAARRREREERERAAADGAAADGAGEGGATEEGASDEGSADEAPREEHAREEHTREEHTREEHTREEHTREEHPRDEHPREERPAEPPPPAVERPPITTDCACPREGVWEVTNLEGWMDCSKPISFKKKLKGKDKNLGTIWILEEDCSRWFGETHERKKREDLLLERVEGCGYVGRSRAEQEGMRVVLDNSMTLEGFEFFTGEMYFRPEGGSMSCEGYRPFEMRWVEPIPADKEPKLRKQMERKLAEYMEKYYLPPE